MKVTSSPYALSYAMNMLDVKAEYTGGFECETLEECKSQPKLMLNQREYIRHKIILINGKLQLQNVQTLFTLSYPLSTTIVTLGSKNCYP